MQIMPLPPTRRLAGACGVRVLGLGFSLARAALTERVTRGGAGAECAESRGSGSSRGWLRTGRPPWPAPNPPDLGFRCAPAAGSRDPRCGTSWARGSGARLLGNTPAVDRTKCGGGVRVLEARVAAEPGETSGSRVGMCILRLADDPVFARHGTEHGAGPRSRGVTLPPCVAIGASRLPSEVGRRGSPSVCPPLSDRVPAAVSVPKRMRRARQSLEDAHGLVCALLSQP